MCEEAYMFVKPHAIMYNTVIDVIARSDTPNSETHTEQILQELEELYQNGDPDMKPTRRSLNAVMLTYWSDVDGGEMTEFVLRLMVQFTKTGVNDVNPDQILYNCAIHTMVENDCPTRAKLSLSTVRSDETYVFHWCLVCKA